MGELALSVLQLVGLFVGRWLLPRLSGGLLIVMPKDTIVTTRLAPYARLPDGTIGVDGQLVGLILALLFLIVVIGLSCLLL